MFFKLVKKLFEELIKNIKESYKSNNSKLRKLHLYVHSSNIRAQGFYKKMGFIHEATLNLGLDESGRSFIFILKYYEVKELINQSKFV